jgi:CRP-like cAMP-binding protein
MIDLEKLKLEFPFLNDLSSSDVFDFLKHVQLIQLKPGDIFLEEGSQKNNLYFIIKGLIRSYYINEKGEEITNRLRYENQIIASYEILFFNQKSRFNFQALEPTELLVINFNELRNIIEQNTKLDTGRRYFMMNILSETLTTVDDFILLSPEQRYLKFIKDHPVLLNRAPIKYIANVLGITPVSLSRIRKRITKKKQ